MTTNITPEFLGLHLFILGVCLCACVHVCYSSCSSTYVDTRGQPAGVVPPFPHGMYRLNSGHHAWWHESSCCPNTWFVFTDSCLDKAIKSSIIPIKINIFYNFGFRWLNSPIQCCHAMRFLRLIYIFSKMGHWIYTITRYLLARNKKDTTETISS